MDDDPVFGRDFGDRRREPLEQGMAVVDIAGSTRRPVPAWIASKCTSIAEAPNATGVPISSTSRWTGTRAYSVLPTRQEVGGCWNAGCIS
jgi:hypothetical protein